MESAFNAKNVSDLASLYDLTAILMPPGEPTVEGRSAIQQWFAEAGRSGLQRQFGFDGASFGVARLFLPPSRAYHSATEPSW
jgi:hypothetical protein